ncbi:MAG: hypothetical protein ACLUE4_06250 [Acutalibacteraceae bacterium]
MYKIINATKRAAVRTAYAKRTRHIINRITFGHYVTTLGIRSFVSDKVVVTDGLLSLSVTQVFNGDEDATVGSVGSSSYSATFNNPSPTYNYRDKIAFIESGVLLADGTYYYTPCGYFATEKPETDDDGKTLTVTGYDEIDKMGGKWTPSITVTDTTTLKDVVENIASMHGLSVTYVDTAAQTALKNHVIGVATAAELTEQSERDVLGYCVGCAGMSARVNTVGKLYISWFFSPGSTYDYTVTADVQWENGFKKSAESAVKIEAVTAGEDEDVYTKGTGVPLSFANPLVTHAEIDAIYTRYNGRAWYPSTCTWRGDPCIEVGDIITVKDKNSKSYTVYVAQQELDLSGGLQSTITSPNLDTTEMSFDSVSASVKLELSKVKNSMEAAIKAATDAINGANGGYYRILDLDKDGNPDGWECFATDGLRGVKCTYGGIGCTTDGGKTYTNAMTGSGINATAITTGIITGGANGFSFNLESGHIEASDINITGGDINLDGGQLSVLNDDGYKADLSGGVLDLYQGAGTGTGEKYLTFGSSMLFETALGGDWYATIAAPEFTLGEQSSKGFRFGTSTANASAAKPAVGGLAYNWDTDFAIIEKSRTRIRQCVETNEAKNDQFESLIHHRPVGGTNFKLGVGIAKMNAEKTPGAGFEIRGETSGKLWAGLYAWTEADNIMRLTFQTSNQDGTTYSKTLTANGELLYFNGRRLKFADE